ncbi:MAG: metal ABC transporter permease [Geminicoccaceae bacterium]
MTLLDDFLVRALLAGIGVALIAGPLGCFVVWRRMAYFGDASAHAALLGVALALLSELPVLVGVLVVTLAMAAGTAALASGRYAMDTMLGVAAHAGLAAGLVALSLVEGVRVDLMAYLFGDVLAVSVTDLAVIWGGAVIIGLLLWHFWRDLLNATLNEELAVAEGGHPKLYRLLLNLLLAFLIAVAMKIVGVLLITAMLIIPAAAARPLARTPEGMAGLAASIGMIAVALGLQGSITFDTPTGPSMALAAALAFLAVNLLFSFRPARRSDPRKTG